MADDAQERIVELLEKTLIIQLHSMGVSQVVIAKVLGKRINDVNNFLKPIAKGKR
jgi:hypothetical protein